MARLLVRCALFAPLLLSSCDVVLTWFGVPAVAAPGTVVTVAIAAQISGASGEAGCVLQLPNGWLVQGVTNNQSWVITRDAPSLLGLYAAEPGHYLAGFSASVAGGPHGSPISQITLAVSVAIPASALGVHRLKVSTAGSQTIGAWQVQQPAGVSQFAAITAAPFARQVAVGVPAQVDFVEDSMGLPPTVPTVSWSGIALGDVDGDGRDDLAAISPYGAGVRCWLSRPGTTWIERSTGLTASTAAGIAFAQLDGDGLLDLVDGNGQVFFGDGGTTWTPATPLPLSLPPTEYASVAVGDVDGDGLTDIVLASGSQGALEVLHNNGDRTFHNASSGLPAASGAAWGGVVLADADGDGDLDLLWTRTTTPNSWLGDGKGGWTPAGALPNPPGPLALGDLNGDGIPEMIVATAASGTSLGLHVCRLTPTGAWVPTSAFSGLPTTGQYWSIVLLDFDRDGRLDLVTARSPATGGVEAWRNTGTGFTLDLESGLPHYVIGSAGFAAGDIDGNALPDLAIVTGLGYPLTGTPSVRTWQNRRTGVVSFGSGCAGGPIAEPRLLTIGLPQRGNASFAAQVHAPMPGATGMFWLGASRVSSGPVPLPFDVTPLGAPGCTIWTSVDILAAGALDAAGNFTVGLPVPTDPTLAFVTLFAQGGVFASAANPLGVVLTGALALRVE